MKPIVFLILIGISAWFNSAECLADQASGQITRQIVDQDYNKDGISDVKLEIVSRGGEKVLMMLSRAAKDSGHLVLRERSFLVGGEIVLCESDKDGDGFLETLTFYRPDTNAVDVFMREENGLVRLATEDEGEHVEQEQQVSALWKRILAPDQKITSEDAMRFIDEVRQGIRNRGRE